MLELVGLRKTYPGFALSLSLAVSPGQTLALLGPSGSGKTTLLRLIAGLEAPEAGQVWLGTTDLTPLPPEARGVGFVFQDYALFPHLSVYENIAFGLREARWEAQQVRARVAELLELTHLEPHAQKRPHQLSGGERQRVALARALAPRPRVLLLDEPLGALDLKLRWELLWELRAILRQVRVPTLVVTHDHAEAFALAEQVALLREGRVVQQGTPERLYRRPKTLWVAAFLGQRNLFSPKESLELGLPARPHLLPQEAIGLGEGEEAQVQERTFKGPTVVLELRWRGHRLFWEGPEPGLYPGDRVGVRIDWSKAVPLEEEAVAPSL
ncbi:Spermidine/putrescine import ATP-binding protein PotA [Meiothermus luteus]|jgi:putative spermidine/putrescine transport system ATP-binding protein|uniref:Spermidine/putrescine import ATP-binding protein PotA n=1 Tax=Meiothermus luteus TaxID=2026184 RepID=A0A399EIJ1_9DEIN|nr:ABC transporter ATP-binding protein [Meiothermus luteus]RIH82899.1 Spermidine/putrescine import ATP-binding protein PotA [Meiothermus luteus]RMH54490.1 MAG: ATP-binding cassette domain-containing protein [Deinococcota bacterium]